MKRKLICTLTITFAIALLLGIFSHCSIPSISSCESAVQIASALEGCDVRRK